MKNGTVKIAALKNLGPKSQTWLNQIGVFTRADIERAGSIEIYRRLRQAQLPASLNLVYAIEAMLENIDWRELSAAAKAELKREIDSL